MIVNRKKYCYGCVHKTYSKTNFSCKIKPIYNNKKCPCIDCILKANCSEICYERIKYAEVYYMYREDIKGDIK